MPDTMLVNVVNEEESRIAIVSGGRLEELSVETAAHEQIEGNIYKAKIVKVIASLDACFVDYGREKNGFLAFADIHPKFFEGARGADGLRKGQELMVQVRKGEIGQKGAALTTYVSIPGRYIVLMPLVNKKGVSRKIQDDVERRELKEVLEGSGIPEDMGYIVRTAGHEQTKQDLSRDVSYLLRLWKKIESQFNAAKAPSLLYQESDIVIRTIRDYFRPSLQEVYVDNAEIHEQVLGFFRAVMPWYTKRVRLYQEKAPLFSKFDLENQIASIYEKAVPLPSGGSIVIEQTEALVSVDVNSGKTMKGKDIEETAFIANQEAATEVARQLRLRDLGGLIVIDFIDMKSSSKRNEVRKTLQKVLKEDKARTDIGTISKFGLLELSRQRIKPAGLASSATCPVCGGTGKVRSAESFALAMLRLVHSTLARKGSPIPRQVRIGLSQDVAVYLLNRKRRVLSELESDFGTSVTVFAEPSLHANQYYCEYRGEGSPRIVTNLPEDYPKSSLKTAIGLPGAAARVARPPAYALMAEGEEDVSVEVPEEPQEEGVAPAAVAATGAASETPESAAEGSREGKKRKRKRRRKKKGPGGEGVAVELSSSPEEGQEPSSTLAPEVRADASVVPPAAEALPSQTGEEDATMRKLSPSAKRRARRRRKKALAATEGAAAPTAPEVPPPVPQPPSVPELQADAPDETAKKSRRPRRGGGSRAKGEVSSAPATEAPPAPQTAVAAPPATGEASNGERRQPEGSEPPSGASPSEPKPAKQGPSRPRRRSRKPAKEAEPSA